MEDCSSWEGFLLKQVESERKKRQLLWTDHISLFPCSAQMGGARAVRKKDVIGSMGRRENGGKVSF